jgi:hypothetical protein
VFEKSVIMVCKVMKMRKRTGKSLTTIPINHILSLAKLFCKERPSRKPKKGRPFTYPEFLILTLFAIKQMDSLSYRQIPPFVRDSLGKIPSLSTLHYRVSKIRQERLEEFLIWLAKKKVHEG